MEKCSRLERTICNMSDIQKRLKCRSYLDSLLIVSIYCTVRIEYGKIEVM